MRRPRGTACAIGLVLVAAAFTAGCTDAGPCLPEPLTVNPTRASAGSAVVVSSPAARCTLAYPPGTSYTLTLVSDADDQALRTTAAPVASDGAFSAAVDIPPGFPMGPATVLVSGSTMDQCGQDPPPGVSCAAYQVTLTITE